MLYRELGPVTLHEKKSSKFYSGTRMYSSSAPALLSLLCDRLRVRHSPRPYHSHLPFHQWRPLLQTPGVYLCSGCSLMSRGLLSSPLSPAAIFRRRQPNEQWRMMETSTFSLATPTSSHATTTTTTAILLDPGPTHQHRCYQVPAPTSLIYTG